MDTFKVLGECYPKSVWAEANGNVSTTWSGYSLWILMDLLKMLNIPDSQIEVVTDLIQRENSTLHPVLQTVAFGGADYMAVDAGLNHERFQNLDFSPIIQTMGLHIFSKENNGIHDGNLFSGMFDNYTNAFILSSLVLLWLYCQLVLKEGPFTAVISVTQLIFNQGWQKKGHHMTWQTHLVFTISMFSYVLIAACFSGQIIAQLLVKPKVSNIDSLEDLEANPLLKVIVKENTFMHTYVSATWKRRGYSNPIVHRNTDYNIEAKRQVISDVLTGKYVYIVTGLFDEMYCPSKSIRQQIYKSEPVANWPIGMVFTKSRNKLVQKVFDNFGWINSFDLFHFHQGNSNAGFFRATGSVLTKPGPSNIECENFPIDKRDQTSSESKQESCDSEDIIILQINAAKPIEIEKLKMVFYIWSVGIGLACFVFGWEFVTNKCKTKNMAIITI